MELRSPHDRHRPASNIRLRGYPGKTLVGSLGRIANTTLVELETRAAASFISHPRDATILCSLEIKPLLVGVAGMASIGT